MSEPLNSIQQSKSVWKITSKRGSTFTYEMKNETGYEGYLCRRVCPRIVHRRWADSQTGEAHRAWPCG
jgi:hypothetical protein